VIALTAHAAEGVRAMRDEGDGPTVRVSSCRAGLRYVVSSAGETRPGDTVAESHGTLVVIDEVSAVLFGDTEFDYDERGNGSPQRASDSRGGSAPAARSGDGAAGA
jgi:Fe-S cluster assembly iron-binding protein IscA